MKYLALVLFVIPLAAQTRLDPDVSDCADSRILPKLELCRVDNCERKESDHREIPVREDEHGEAVLSSVDGDSRSIMYVCAENATPADIVRQAGAALRATGFEVPYQFTEKEASLTAHKGDTWIIVDSASHYYTLVELKAANDLETATDAVAMAEAIERYGHVPAYGISFFSGRADISPESVLALREVAAMLEEHPDWRIRVTGHTDNVGTKEANNVLSSRRATAVVAWLVNRGIKRTRLEVAGLGDTEPVAPNETEEGRARNRRIELVKITAQ
jgi:outer membrane protein OmpA-like peptidoglycan-associated protein